MKVLFQISMKFEVLPFPIKIYPVEIFTRAMPGSSLVIHVGIKSLEKPPGPSRVGQFFQNLTFICVS